MPARSGNPGDGNGDGIIQGHDYAFHHASCFLRNAAGESANFWTDLSYAGLIGEHLDFPGVWLSNGTDPSVYFPKAKIGKGEVLATCGGDPVNILEGSINYYMITDSVDMLGGNTVLENSLTAMQAFNIDSKLDDGRPRKGRVLAFASVSGGGTAYNESNNDCMVGVSEPIVYDISTPTANSVACALTIPMQ
jgi:hypothetical protein